MYLTQQQIKEELLQLYRQKEYLLKRELFKKDLFELCHLVGFTNLSKKSNCHRDLCRAIEATEGKYLYRLFLFPRGHFKTSIIAIANTVRNILNNPNIRILLVSSTMENAKKVLNIIKNIFRLCPDFRKYFPEYCPAEDVKEWGTQTAFTVPNRTNFVLKEATVEVAGIGQTIVGRHFDKIVLSDIVTPENVTTPAQIQKVKDWVEYCISLLHNPEKNPIDMEGTRYDFNDVYGDWEEKAKQKNSQFFVYKRPAIIINEKGEEEPLFPERFSIAGLKKLQETQGSYKFAGQYMLEPIDEETAPFKKKDIKYIERKRLPRVDNKLPPRFMAIDVAISEDKKADYSVITTAVFDNDNNEYIVDIEYGRWNTNTLLKNIIRAYKKWTPQVMAIETVAFQKMLVNVLYELSNREGIILPIKEIPRNTHTSKNYRIMSLQWRFAQHKILFCDDLDKSFIENQIIRYNPDRKHNADDLLDTLADLEEIKIVPKQKTVSEYEQYPMKRFVDWLLRTDVEENEEFSFYEDEEGIENEYYCYDNFSSSFASF